MLLLFFFLQVYICYPYLMIWPRTWPIDGMDYTTSGWSRITYTRDDEVVHNSPIWRNMVYFGDWNQERNQGIKFLMENLPWDFVVTVPAGQAIIGAVTAWHDERILDTYRRFFIFFLWVRFVCFLLKISTGSMRWTPFRSLRFYRLLKKGSY